MDYSSPGSSVHGILQARILEWVAISFSRGSSQSKDRTHVSCIADGFFIVWATREVLWKWNLISNMQNNTWLCLLCNKDLSFDARKHFAPILVAINNLWASVSWSVKSRNYSVCSLRPLLSLIFNKIRENFVKDSLFSECFQIRQEVTQWFSRFNVHQNLLEDF